MSRNKKTSPTVVRRRSGSSFEMVFLLILIGLMSAAMPIKSRMFKILLPMTLPRSMSVLPLTMEVIETASSGAPVPKATMVRPMSCLLILKFEATLDAPSTSQSAPLIKMTKPPTRSKTCNNMLVSMCLFYSFMVILYHIILKTIKNGANEETLTLDLFLGKEAL